MSVSKSTSVIQLAIVYIKDDNLKQLQTTLSVMPLDRLGDQSEKLLSGFLSVCAAYDRKDAAKMILKAWKVVYPPEEKMQVASRLFLIEQINLETLSYIVLNDQSFTYVELMDDLIEFDNSGAIITACQKADKIFGTQPYETYKIIQDHAYEHDNDNVYDYATDKMEETAPYAELPTWLVKPAIMKSDEELQKIPEKDTNFEIPTDEEAVELLTKGLSHLGISVDDLERAKTFLLQKLSVSTMSEKIEILKPVMKNQANEAATGDKELFRIFGPANPLVDQDLTLNTPSSKYGGERMFLSETFSYNEEFEFVEDWFSPCNFCHLKIRKRWHALRKPRPHGGFVGCYCSFKCIRESVFWDGDEPDLLTHELINIFEKEIKETGIYDRTD